MLGNNRFQPSLLAVLLIFLLSVYCHEQRREPAVQSYNATIYMDKAGRYVYKPGVIDSQGLAQGTFKDSLTYNGWGVLDVRSGYSELSASDDQIMYAAGYLEGALTYRHIYMHYQNTVPAFFDGKSQKVIQEVKDFLVEQYDYMLQSARAHKADSLWRSVGLLMSQLEGLMAGYAASAPPSMQLDKVAFLLSNSGGDMPDILSAVDKPNRPNFKKMTKEQIKRHVQKSGHCSALIKVLGAYENVFFSHSTWFQYQSTNRIWKYYSLNVKAFVSKELSFSSYPGYLESLDDFYMTGNGLIILETTNDLFNTSLFDLITPYSLPAWVRVRTANQLSQDGEEWGFWLSQNNSGTYNNQYMVLDLNKVRLNESIEDGALYVVEQIPGYVEYGDQTAQLRLGYWPSYNVPFYEKIYNLSGYPEIVASQGFDFSYQLAPRAKIFRRDAAKVTDMDSMKHIMRYNDYLNDPYSEKDSCDTICCRGDLNGAHPTADGCLDTKVSDYFMAAQRAAWIINGPSTGDYLKPFTWNQFNNVSHIGLPYVYNFDFVLVKPTL